MFSFFKKQPSSKLRVMGHDVEVALITRGGKILYTGDVVNRLPKDHLEGQIFEVTINTRSGAPYFVYYLCEDYYFAVATSYAESFGGPLKAEQFRSSVSERLVLFLVDHLKRHHEMDARADVVSFSHNRAHTNVLAYVNSRNEWHAIQHNDSESDSASERKVARVNDGAAAITEFVAVSRPSPNGRGD